MPRIGDPAKREMVALCSVNHARALVWTGFRSRYRILHVSQIFSCQRERRNAQATCSDWHPRRPCAGLHVGHHLCLVGGDSHTFRVQVVRHVRGRARCSRQVTTRQPRGGCEGTHCGCNWKTRVPVFPGKRVRCTYICRYWGGARNRFPNNRYGHSITSCRTNRFIVCQKNWTYRGHCET